MSTTLPRLATLLALALCATAHSAPADATVLRYLSPEALASRSDAVVHGRIASAEARWNDDRTVIVTEWRLDVLDALHGEPGAAPGETLRVVRVGGAIDGLELGYEGMPVAEPGDEVVLALQTSTEGADAPARIVALSQGLFHVRDGVAERDLSAVANAPTAVQRLALQELRGRLAFVPRREADGR